MRQLILCLFLASFAFQFANASSLRRAEHFRPLHSVMSAPVGSTYFIALDGTLLPHEDASMLFEKLTVLFDTPLRVNKIGLFSYIMEVRGNTFYMNFIAEPLNETQTTAFADYIAKLEGTTVHGVPIDFKKVTSLHEVATFQAGNFNDKLMDPFDKSFELARHFTFNNLAGWYNFTEAYGFAFSSKDHSVFEKYLENFIADKADYQQVTEVLKKSNMAAIDPRVSLVLEDNSTVDSELENTPFLPFKFFRVCFLEEYGSGNCYK